MILSEDDIAACLGFGEHTCESTKLTLTQVARAVESKIVEKLKQQGPEGYWFADDPAVCAYPGSGYFHGPVPPKDAVNVAPLYTLP